MITLGRGVSLITRDEWAARDARTATSVNPTFGSTAHWEGPHMGWPWDHAACFSLVRGIQRFHMDSRGWSDIAYSFVACPHGFVFEGRWVGVRTAANGTTDGNNRAYAGCYLGGQDDEFTAGGRVAMRVGMDYLDAHGAAGPNRNGHGDWKATACPGDEIYGWVHNGQPATDLEDDMPLTHDDIPIIQQAVRNALDEGTGAGQQGWAATSAAQLATAQGAINLLHQVIAEVRVREDIDTGVVVQGLLDGLIPAMAEATPDATEFAAKVVELLPEDDARELLAELGRILTAAS